MKYPLSSLRARLWLPVLFAVIPVFALNVYTTIGQRQDAIADAERDALNLVRLAAREQGRFIASTKQLLVSMSKLPEVRHPTSPQACHRALADVLQPFSYYRLIGLALPDGTVYCRSSMVTTKVNISDRAYFQRAMNTRDFSIGDYQIGRATLKNSINFGQAVLDEDGTVLTMVFVALDLDWLNELIAVNELPAHAAVTVIDSKGTILARAPEPQKWVGKTLPDSALIKTILARKSEGTVEMKGLDGVTRIYAFTPLHEGTSDNVYVSVGLSKEVALAAANAEFTLNLVLLILVAALALLFAAMGTNYVMRRVKALSAAARRLEQGDLGARTGLQHGDEELGDLASAFDHMAAGLQAMTGTLRDSEARFRSLTELSSDWFWEQDRNLRYTSRSDGGPSSNDSLGKTRWELPIVGVSDTQWEAHKALLAARKPFHDFEYQRLYPDGSIHHVSISGTPIFDEHGDFTGYRGIGRDITDRKRAQERITYLAQFDTLTGLPNRHMLHDRLSQLLQQAQRSGERTGCMFIDLDRFKDINDTFGHSVGDKLLVLVAKRLSQCLRSSDTVGRLGGDEFAVALSAMTRAEDVGLVAQKVIAALAAPFNLDNHAAYVSASIGIALYPSDGADADELLRNADTAMYRAKEEGRNSFQIYLPHMNERVTRRLHLETDLRSALERNEFVLHYQPKVELAGGAISGFEALLRWQHPERGLVSPLEFIPVLEDTGLIESVGEWVLQTACDQIRAWQAQGLAAPPIAVNLSARQFQQADLDVRLHQIMVQRLVDCSLIKLEITESMLMRNPETAAQMLGKLKQIGVKLSVDDFGTGYSSLAYLKRFPLDELKIDRAFVRDVTTDPDDAEIAMAIISLAHNLQLNVVAEGVETEAQLNFLRAQGCDEMQGYYFSKPLKAEDCTQMLIEGRRLKMPVRDAASGGAITVLLVDDNPHDMELMHKALEPGGYRMLSADSPQAAFDILASHEVDIVLSDHNMPSMSGVKFLSRVRKQYPHAVRIVASGAGDAAMVTDAVNEAGVHKYLSKDWDPARLLLEVREAYLRGLEGRDEESPSRRGTDTRINTVH